MQSSRKTTRSAPTLNWYCRRVEGEWKIDTLKGVRRTTSYDLATSEKSESRAIDRFIHRAVPCTKQHTPSPRDWEAPFSIPQTSMIIWLLSFIVSRADRRYFSHLVVGVGSNSCVGLESPCATGARDGAALDPSSKKLISPLTSHSPLQQPKVTNSATKSSATLQDPAASIGH